MGFVGKLIGGILGFGGSQRAANPVVIPQPSVTAQQLVPQTTAEKPDAPMLGSNNNKQKRQRTSRASLKIDRSDTGASPLNM